MITFPELSRRRAALPSNLNLPPGVTDAITDGKYDPIADLSDEQIFVLLPDEIQADLEAEFATECLDADDRANSERAIRTGDDVKLEELRFKRERQWRAFLHTELDEAMQEKARAQKAKDSD